MNKCWKCRCDSYTSYVFRYAFSYWQYSNIRTRKKNGTESATCVRFPYWIIIVSLISVHRAYRISNEDLNVPTGIPVTTKWWITIECRHLHVSQHHISSACLKLGTKKRDKFGLNGKKFVHNHLAQFVVSAECLILNGTFVQILVQLTNVEINLNALFCSTWTAYILNRWMGFSSSFNYKVSHNNWN